MCNCHFKTSAWTSHLFGQGKSWAATGAAVTAAFFAIVALARRYGRTPTRRGAVRVRARTLRQLRWFGLLVLCRGVAMLAGASVQRIAAARPACPSRGLVEWSGTNRLAPWLARGEARAVSALFLSQLQHGLAVSDQVCARPNEQRAHPLP